MLVAALCLVLPEATAGAQARSEDPRTASRMRGGPFYLTPAVALTEFGIDTNVFNAAGERKKDFTFTVTPGLVTAVPIARRGLLRLSTRADLVYYRRYASERSINPQVALRGELYLNRLALFAEPAYLRTRQRPSFEIDVRSLRVEQGTAAGAEARVFPKLSVELSVRELRTTFDADEFFLGTNLGETLNRVSRTYGVAGRWAFTPLTTFVVRGESIEDRFLSSEIRDADSVRVTGGVELKPRALVSGHAQVGVRRFNALDVRVPDFTGLVASGDLSYKLLGSTTFQIRGDRDAGYSFEPLQPYYVESGYGATVRRQLVGRFDAMASFDRHHYAYRDLTPGWSLARRPPRSQFERRHSVRYCGRHHSLHHREALYCRIGRRANRRGCAQSRRAGSTRHQRLRRGLLQVSRIIRVDNTVDERTHGVHDGSMHFLHPRGGDFRDVEMNSCVGAHPAAVAAC
ncbi:MAG: hypothetical protein EXQ55_05245 [Acidobacteria bacterium]|nr:hypothetical protein [Acidobacteriota bacterium]